VLQVLLHLSSSSEDLRVWQWTHSSPWPSQTSLFFCFRRLNSSCLLSSALPLVQWPSPLCFIARAGLRPPSSCLCLPTQYTPPHLAYWLPWGLANFLTMLSDLKLWPSWSLPPK
jgi:hypothetical protein